MIKGYFLKIPYSRRDVFMGSVESKFFAEPVPRISHGRGSPLIVFVSSNEGEITHIASGRLGVNAGTGLRRLNLENIHTPKIQLKTTDILTRAPANVRRHISGIFKNGGVLPPKSFSAVVDAIYSIDSEISSLLTRYGTQRREAIANLSESVIESLAAQKEAIGSALNFAGLDRSPLLEWTPTRDKQPISFLDDLPRAYLREDQMIFNDLNNVPGLDKIKTSITGAARFEGEGVRLDVILANRTRLEEQTGADLIYYNATYKSFVMVQYKAMEQTEDKHEAVYRLPNAKLNEEIARMDQLLEKLQAAPLPSVRDGYRLNENPFFLKLCPRIELNPDEVKLATGMYFSRDHWRFLETDGDLVGPRGGRVITFKNAGRYFTNTIFTEFVQNAWVGTTPEQSFLLEPVVLEILESGKALVIGVKSVLNNRNVEEGADEDIYTQKDNVTENDLPHSFPAF